MRQKNLERAAKEEAQSQRGSHTGMEMLPQEDLLAAVSLHPYLPGQASGGGS